MDSPCLNNDVLLDIIAQSDSHQTGLAVMSTCRFLYQEGTKVLLRKPVWLDTEERLVSFLYFLLKEPKIRPQHVRELMVHTYDLSSLAAEVFGLVCPLMTSLRRLDVLYSETMIDSHADLLCHLTLINSLTSLTLSSAEFEAYKLLKVLRAPLKTISVSWLPDARDCFFETIDEDVWPRFHPTILLENFAETLEELTCIYWYVSREYEAPRKTYPKMRRLVINECSHHFILAPFIQAFPNLSHVSFKSYRHELGDQVFEDFRENQELNIAYQHAAPSSGGRAWKHMQEFSGNFVDFYICGFACPVRRLILEDSWTGNTIPILADMLSRTCPEYLEYSTCSDQTFDGLGLLSTGLRGASATARSRLTTLVILFRCSNAADTTLPRVMDRLASAIWGIPLQVLKLIPEYELIEEFDFGAFARTLFDRVPSLQTVEVSFGRAWKTQVVMSLGRDGPGNSCIVATCQ